MNASKIIRERYRYLSSVPNIIDLLRSGATLKYKNVKVKMINKHEIYSKYKTFEYTCKANNIELFKLLNIIDNGI